MEQLNSLLSSYRPTPAESSASTHLFTKADTDSLGVLTGDKAVPFFSHSSLPPILLGEIWQICDPDNSGFLTDQRFGVACRLIGHAQREKALAGGVAGNEVKEEWVAARELLLPCAEIVEGSGKIGVDFSGVRAPRGTDDTYRERGNGSPSGLREGGFYAVEYHNCSRFHSKHLPGVSFLCAIRSTPTTRPSALRTDCQSSFPTCSHSSAGPLPKFEGFPLPAPILALAAASPAPPPPAPAAVHPQSTGQQPQQSTTTTLVTPEEKVRYARLFEMSGPVRGLLDGDKARDIFIKSKLPFDVLGQIWNLADTSQRGSLSVTDFTLGMHLIQHLMNGSITSLPTSLSPQLIASASTNFPLSPQTTGFRNIPTSSVPSSPLAQQFTGSKIQQQGQGQQFPTSPVGNSRFNPPPSIVQQQQPWLITPTEKLEADHYFLTLDPNRTGGIEGEAAVGFFGLSGLGTDVLARVWDLADIRGTGSLNQDEFAVALKLIRDTVAGQELPSALSLAMTPPSLRHRTPSTPSHYHPHGLTIFVVPRSVLQQQQVQQPPQPQRDLLDLLEDDEPTPTIPTPIVAQNTANFNANLQATNAMAPFQAQMNTGMSSNQGGLQGTIFPQSTGSRDVVSASTSSPPINTSATNFFSENENADLRASLVSSQTTLASLENSNTTLAKSLTNLTTERTTLEESLTSTNSLISNLQSQLAISRTSYLAEQEMITELTQRTLKQKELLDRAKFELISSESDLSGLRVTKNELEGNYLRDKEEIRELRKRVNEVEGEKKKLEEEIEVIEKERRREKGLGAIARKQLAGVAADKEQKEKELEVLKASAGVEAGADEEEEITTPPTSRAVDPEPPIFDVLPSHASSIPLPLSTVVSPSLSLRSTNPFERLVASSAVSSPSPIVSDATAVPGTHASDASEAATYASIVAGGIVAGEEVETSAEEVDPFGLPRADVKGKGKEVSTTSFEDAFEDDFSKAVVLPPSMETEELATRGFEEEAHEVSPKVKDEESVVPTVAPIEQKKAGVDELEHEDEDEESSDDDEGPEQVEVEEATAVHTPAKEREGTHSDSGDSFVHVSTPPPHTPSVAVVAELEGEESKFPAIEDLEEPKLDKGKENAPLEVTIPSSSSATSTLTTPTTKKRAAPPPPPGRSPSVIATSSNSNPSPVNFTSKSPQASSLSKDDFDESIFDDLPPPAPVVPSSVNKANTKVDFDEFDDAFDTDFAFQPAFPAATSPGPSTSVGGASGGNTNFDDSFANFDAAFDPIVPASPVVSGAGAGSAAGQFSFDDAFGNEFTSASPFSSPPKTTAPTSKSTPAPSGGGDGPPGYLEARSLPAPSLPARPAVTPALEDDVPGVKTLVDMGFSRSQALEALQKYDFDETRAVNSMLG